MAAIMLKIHFDACPLQDDFYFILVFTYVTSFDVRELVGMVLWPSLPGPGPYPLIFTLGTLEGYAISGKDATHKSSGAMYDQRHYKHNSICV